MADVPTQSDYRKYKLRTEVKKIHTSDIRCLTPYLNGFVTGSRDTTVKILLPTKSDERLFHEAMLLSGPSHFVSSLCCDTSGTEVKIYVGSNDANIYCYSPDSATPLLVHKKHTGTVCVLKTNKKGELLSGSWDTTARFWRGESLISTLEGHEASVWAADFLTDESIVTASADKTIKIWNTSGECLKTFTGHEDVIRCISVVNEKIFLTCSNDASIKQWNVDEKGCINTFYGHENYVYSIRQFPDSTPENIRLVSCSEDRSVRIWSNGTCLQTIRLPPTTLWDVYPLDNNNIAVAASTGSAYVLTRDEKLEAPPEEQRELEDEVSKTSIPIQELGEIKADQLPGPFALMTPGTRDGQTKLIREGSIITCYQWSKSEDNWVKVGEVVGSAGGTKDPSQKNTFEGKEYDYVFSIDVQEGSPPLKLPYNISENPYEAAQNFIHKHELSQYFLDEVANFIIKNTKSQTVTRAPEPQFQNPFAD